MSHDESWQFLVLGRSLERADMTARMLSTRDVHASGLSWVNAESRALCARPTRQIGCP